MTTKTVEDEIKRFLANQQAEVLCITGKWGVGKTYSWSRYLREANNKNRVALTRYAYVSLFGQNSLDDLRYAIFENTVPLDQLDSGPNFNSVKASLHLGEKWVRKLLYLGNIAPVSRSILNSAGRTLFLAVRDQIVCIDDVERHGNGLKVKDVLGMLSFLKEQRNCKVVLLLNDEKLKGDAQQDFRAQLEKVVDTRITFAPTSAEAAEIGVSSTAPFRDFLVPSCISLGITNIRIIKKIEYLCFRLYDLLKAFDPGVSKQAIQTAVLFGWCHYEPDTAPSVAFVASYGQSYGGLQLPPTREGDANAQEKAWAALLADYGFTNADEFDLVVLKGIQDGYFDKVAIEAAGQKLNNEIEFRNKDNSFQEAWNLFHSSFQQNADEVLDKMACAFLRSVETISPINLSATISLFKDLGRKDQSYKLLEFYMDQRVENPKFYDLVGSPFGNEVKDPDVREAFKKKLATFETRVAPAELLQRVAVHRSWNPEDLDTLAGLSADDFRQMFEAHSGKELRGMIKAALDFETFSNANQQMITIAARATEALKAIGRQSAINARRIRIYGIAVEALAQDEAAPDSAEGLTGPSKSGGCPI